MNGQVGNRFGRTQKVSKVAKGDNRDGKFPEVGRSSEKDPNVQQQCVILAFSAIPQTRSTAKSRARHQPDPSNSWSLCRSFGSPH